MEKSVIHVNKYNKYVLLTKSQNIPNFEALSISIKLNIARITPKKFVTINEEYILFSIVFNLFLEKKTTNNNKI